MANFPWKTISLYKHILGTYRAHIIKRYDGFEYRLTVDRTHWYGCRICGPGVFCIAANSIHINSNSPVIITIISPVQQTFQHSVRSLALWEVFSFESLRVHPSSRLFFVDYGRSPGRKRRQYLRRLWIRRGFCRRFTGTLRSKLRSKLR